MPDDLPQLSGKFGLVPYTDAIENVSADEIPGLAATFGLSQIAVPKVGESSDDESKGLSPFELVSALLTPGMLD